MKEKVPQTYANHHRFVPFYHFVLSGILLINLLWKCYRAYRALTGDGSSFGFSHVFGILMSLALIGIYFYARMFALKVQDRVIRLEERLRLAEVLPDDLKRRIDELRPDQLVGLRFAPDDELPELVRDALDHGTGNEDIKKKIKTWRPDYLRA